MVYDRSSRERADREFDYGTDTGDGRDYTYTSARDYDAARGGRNDRGGYGGGGYGGGDYGRGGYGRDQNRGSYVGGYGRDQQPYGAREYGNDRYARQDRYGRGQYGAGRSGQGQGDYHGAYASDGRPFEDIGRYRDADDDYRGGQRQYGSQRDRGGSYGRQPQGYQYEDRGFLERAGDEVRSWFGDDDAERRREMDNRYDERFERTRQGHRDDDYHSWRSGQIAALDRDYDEYRRENRSKFDSEFSTWRTGRQSQRDQLTKVKEHQEVVGSDGAHVGTVDKVKGDRILLTKNDKDAGGQHHSIPSSWITLVDDKVTLSKTADEAKRAWQDEDRNSAMFGYGDNAKRGRDDDRGGDGDRTGGNLNRSFSGTY